MLAIDYEKGRARIYAECVALGMKPVAQLGEYDAEDSRLVQLRNEFLNLSLEQGIRYVEVKGKGGKVGAYFTRYHHQQIILRAWEEVKAVLGEATLSPEERAIFYHWLEGKVYGYSEEAIKDWVEQRPESFVED